MGLRGRLSETVRDLTGSTVLSRDFGERRGVRLCEKSALAGVGSRGFEGAEDLLDDGKVFFELALFADAEDQKERPWPRPSLIVHDPSREIANQEQEGE